MKQSDRIAALEAAVKQLQEEMASIKNAPPHDGPPVNSPVANTDGKWGVQVPEDEDSWIWLTDLTTGAKNVYDTQEEAAKVGARWGVHRVMKMGRA